MNIWQCIGDAIVKAFEEKYTCECCNHCQEQETRIRSKALCSFFDFLDKNVKEKLTDRKV